MEKDVASLTSEVYGPEGLPVIRRTLLTIDRKVSRTNAILTAVAVSFFTASITFVAVLIQGSLTP